MVLAVWGRAETPSILCPSYILLFKCGHFGKGKTLFTWMKPWVDPALMDVLEDGW